MMPANRANPVKPGLNLVRNTPADRRDIEEMPVPAVPTTADEAP
jgi:hypothetical protein